MPILKHFNLGSRGILFILSLWFGMQSGKINIRDGKECTVFLMGLTIGPIHKRDLFSVFFQMKIPLVPPASNFSVFSFCLLLYLMGSLTHHQYNLSRVPSHYRQFLSKKILGKILLIPGKVSADDKVALQSGPPPNERLGVWRCPPPRAC